MSALAAERTPTWGVAFRESRLVNIPINRVQSEVENVHGEQHQHDLLLLWKQGYRMDVSNLESIVNTGVHEEILLNVRRRSE
jgi:hypothetical protein